MAEESEKRFHAVMDKLFFAPSPNSNSNTKSKSTSATAGGLLRGRKRPHTMTTTLARADSKFKGGTIEELRNASGGTVQSPMCRPWDREDLLKRLATFKSMTWFAKPEVVSAINCARRGWINVDMDTIACESCRARLFFSTPSSWAQQQVEKAASVFSLKLNNGHKLLCPWVDNACDEKLAQFPPTSPADLVDDYKKRCASLLQLSELPVISSTAIEHMSCPLFDHFIKNHPPLDKYDSVSARGSGDECEEVLPVLYYSAQKLIALCGWEPQLLPYMVDCKDVHDQSMKCGTLPELSDAQNTSITVYSENENRIEQYDHTSVVLECHLCGARVGLWAFHSTPRPLEFVRLIGHAETSEASCQTNHSQTAISNRNLLNLTIAGGPPPAEQNLHPTISLPVVGQNLRTRFSSAFESIDTRLVEDSTSNGLVDADDTVAMTNKSNDTATTEDQSGNIDSQSLNIGDNTPHNVETVSMVLGNPLKSSSACLGKDSKQASCSKAMEFDPIKQHRHFCPWIISSGKSAPGWKQTLSALERQKEFAWPSEITQPSSSLIEVEDPVASVKKLLTPPSAKRKKFTHGSTAHHDIS